MFNIIYYLFALCVYLCACLHILFWIHFTSFIYALLHYRYLIFSFKAFKILIIYGFFFIIDYTISNCKLYLLLFFFN